MKKGTSKMEQHNLGLTDLEVTSPSYIAQDAFVKKSMVHHSLCLSSQGGSNHSPPRGDPLQCRFLCYGNHYFICDNCKRMYINFHIRTRLDLCVT